MQTHLLTKALKIIGLIALTGYFLFHAKPFLAPLVFGGLLAMLLLPVSLKVEGWGASRAVGTTAAIFVLIVIVAAVVGLLAWQLSGLAKDGEQIERNVNQRVEQVREFVTGSIGISEKKQQEIIQKQKQESSSKIATMATGALASAGKALTNMILVVVYLFLFLYFRSHLKNFVLKLMPQGKGEEAKEVMQNGRKVAQRYLGGMFVMIACLWVMYGIGFSIAGVKNAVFFAILCGLLEIIPFVGNLLGTAITVFASMAQGAGTNLIIGILATYAVVQFIQTYLLEPMVVGRGVNLHPMVTIIGLVLGEFIWGIPGMVLAIPVLGITKILCDHVESLQPYAYLLGEERKPQTGIIDKVKGWIGKKGESQ